jgi:transcriptional regulator GlxA family with amidase domain
LGLYGAVPMDIDLALAMIEKDLGADLARAVARKLVVYHRRAGGQSQFSALLTLEPKSDRIQSALAYAKRNLDTPLTVPQLAEAAHLSPRQFSRAFRAETGQSPAKAVENLRVEAARLMMEQSRHPIDAIARQTGFADRDRMRRAFLRTFGQPPQVIRRNAACKSNGLNYGRSPLTPMVMRQCTWPLIGAFLLGAIMDISARAISLDSTRKS